MTICNRGTSTKRHAELQRGHRPKNRNCNTGRPKTDELDAMWLARLAPDGLLRASFAPFGCRHQEAFPHVS